MFNYLFFVVFLVFVVIFLFLVYQFLKHMRIVMRYYLGYLQDIRVDEFFRKAVIIGEIQSYDKDIEPQERVSVSIERAMSIVSDVLMQNGYNPKAYNLKGLVLLWRNQLGIRNISVPGGNGNEPPKK